ncbi:EAL domain-containing protein [Humitalea sp. 24SJ18S-53]|uniref:EAL domain-containing protein n=1 Tax=Humitalea sp. 24SJ18S-53 TaxID=3422307 RepID=UPI003D6790E4
MSDRTMSDAPMPAARGGGEAALSALGGRERFVAFAFAAAECLLETDSRGVIGFAVGAFRSRFGREADSLIGQPIAALAAAEDRALLEAAISTLASRGRLAPCLIRLGGHAVLSGLAMPGVDGQLRLCLTIGPAPTGLSAAALPGNDAPTGAGFLRAAEARMLESPSRLGLLEITGPAAARIAAGDAALGGALASALAEHASPGALAGSMAPGRFGVMQTGEGTLALDAAASAMSRLLAERGVAGGITTLELPLASEGMNETEAARALRHALSAFTRGGGAGLAAAGMCGGLQAFLGVVAQRRAGYRRAIAERRFRMDYQPICGLADRQPHHYEALLRPEPGLPGVEEFVSIVEGAGLSEELDLAVAGVAIEACKAGPSIAFNISGHSAQSPRFRASLLDLVDLARVPPGRLLIELTESAEIEDEQQAATTIAALRERGIAACIDDFGAGAASFRYLRAFRVDYVKLDGSYVQAAATQERERSFIASMIDLARAVGAKTVAERVETEDDVARMIKLGVDYGQGWLFGRPGPMPSGRRRGSATETWS